MPLRRTRKIGPLNSQTPGNRRLPRIKGKTLKNQLTKEEYSDLELVVITPELKTELFKKVNELLEPVYSNNNVQKKKSNRNNRNSISRSSTSRISRTPTPTIFVNSPNNEIGTAERHGYGTVPNPNRYEIPVPVQVNRGRAARHGYGTVQPKKKKRFTGLDHYTMTN